MPGCHSTGASHSAYLSFQPCRAIPTGTVCGVRRVPFSAPVKGGVLGGWSVGEGRPVIVLHGGPGVSYEMVDGLMEELSAEFEVATFQQRGLAPSIGTGPFTIAQAVQDIAAVLDHLGWNRAMLVGHSWGGHLAFHAAVAIPERLSGVLSVDPLGAVGDGGEKDFHNEMLARMPEALRARVVELEAREEAGEGTEAEALESLTLVWPSYFARPERVMDLPPVAFSLSANAQLWADMQASLPGLEATLPSIGVPVGVLVGGLSPMPPDEAGLATATRIPAAWSHVEPEAGHFPWFEAPGCVLAAARRLAATSA